MSISRKENFEYAFSIDTSRIKFGNGVTKEIGYEVASLGMSRSMVVVDPNVMKLELVEVITNALKAYGVNFEIFDQVEIEPTDLSFKKAIDFAKKGNFDGYVAVGGGSTIDTMKAANLYATYPSEFLAYVNYPIGEGLPVPGKLKPMVAVPTTAGTGSETTGVAIFDYLSINVKTGIAHRYLRPDVGLVDPDNTLTLPKMVAACSGFDVLCHGLESFTALPYQNRIAPKTPSMRPAYQGSNPISDVWAKAAIEMASSNIISAVENSSNVHARSQMMLAATFAGVGFGNAGVHLPHGMSYPVSGMVKDFVPDGYSGDKPIVPHGMSVILNAPAVFKFTYVANPGRHIEAAKLMGVDIDRNTDNVGLMLSDAITDLIKALNLPNGLNALGYCDSDIESLVKGTLPQHRVTKLSPRVANESDLRALFKDSMKLW